MPGAADFYGLEDMLDEQERGILRRVRTFMEKEVAPVINRYWVAAQFPHELIPGLRELGIAGLPYAGYGCGGARPLLDGLVALELARVDPSIATFMGVHGGLAMASPSLRSAPAWRAA
jgi:glutaryl-CoA dehydrogenase